MENSRVQCERADQEHVCQLDALRPVPRIGGVAGTSPVNNIGVLGFQGSLAGLLPTAAVLLCPFIRARVVMGIARRRWIGR